MASYPNSVFSPASKSNGQTIDASHINDLQGEVVAIEEGLLNGSAPLNSSNSTLAALSVTGRSTFAGDLTINSSVVTFTSTSASNPWAFNSGNASPNGLQIVYTQASPNGTSNEFLLCGDTTTTRLTIRSNGGIANFQANDVNLSDASLKEIAGEVPPQTEAFRHLQLVLARYADAPQTPLDVMVTAQQVQRVYPDLVTEFSDGHLGVREHGLMMRAFKVIQELDARVQTLEAKLRG